MVGPKHVWMTYGDYPDRWWRTNDTSACSNSQIERALESYLATDILTLSTSRKKTDAKIVSGKSLYEDCGLILRSRNLRMLGS